MKHRTKMAFTLSEVLITIGIIGVVSAMTIPNLVANYQKRQTAEKLKKVYTTIVNAVRLSEIDNDDMSGWNYPKGENITFEQFKPFIEQYYQPYFKGSKLYKIGDYNNYYQISTPRSNNILELMDGTALSFYGNYNPETKGGYIWLFIDLNGASKPNKIGKDIFVLEISSSKDYNPEKKVIFYRFIGDNYIEKDSGCGCNKNNQDSIKNYCCGRVIQKNNWKIPKDYPW